MIDLAPLTAAIVMGGLAYLASRAEGPLDRLIRIKEEELEMHKKQLRAEVERLEERAKIEAGIKAPMPSDIQLLINGESEKWAREELQQRAITLYMALGDWDKVRAALHAELDS